MSDAQPTRRGLMGATAVSAAVALMDLFPKAYAVGQFEHNLSKGLSLDDARAYAAAAVSTNITMRLTPQCDGCVDGRQQGGTIGIHSPGAHYGYYLCLCALANLLAQETDNAVLIPREIILETLRRVIGGFENFRYHSGCGYIDTVRKNPRGFNVTADDIRAIDTFVKESHSSPYIVSGPHRERAIFRVVHLDDVDRQGKNVLSFETSVLLDGQETHAFVFQETFVDEIRVRLLADALHDLYSENLGSITEGKLYGMLCDIQGQHARHIFRVLAPHLIQRHVFQVTIEDRKIRSVILSKWLAE